MLEIICSYAVVDRCGTDYLECQMGLIDAALPIVALNLMTKISVGCREICCLTPPNPPPFPLSRLVRAGVVDIGSSVAEKLHLVVGGRMPETHTPGPLGQGRPPEGRPAREPSDAQSTVITLRTREALA